MRANIARITAAMLAGALALMTFGCGHRPVEETRISRHYHHGRTGFQRHTATRHRH